ncbi:PilN domain-containing protein [Salirhabdus salicampi]|uniref:PilN domain-containing protein n=1 Tax=Salirhabdus salicampi TaxID=476102 RepID=UPI0020C2CA9B|nr:hypothetical protein [Salirhabdus salicampi]MCP8617939.1 hypothetical protein [Salirhabdus salicampi]
MLVEVNLLPRKERKSKIFVFGVASSVLLLAAVSVLAFYYISSLKENIAQMEKQASQVEQQASALQAELNDSVSDFSQLDHTVTMLRDYPVASSQVVANASKLLPSAGYFQSLQYHAGSISLNILLEDDIAAAYYFNHLSNAEWVNEVTLSSVAEQGDGYIAHYQITVNADVLKGGR